MLEMASVTIRYNGCEAVSGLSLSLTPGRIGCLIGPSGCGKTSILRAIAGFEQPASGNIRLGERIVSTPTYLLAPEQRRIGMVFQDLALFPHLNVAGNVGFGLRGERRQRQRRIDELLALVGLGGMAGAYPHELSGGQQQRVAVARAMAPRPDLMLLDEPFSSLDPALRESLPRELRQIFHADGITVLQVTHDQAEAFAMADEIGVLREGQLEQWDTPYGLYHKPRTRFVADFIGEGIMIPAQVIDANHIETELGRVRAPVPTPCRIGGYADVLMRPDDIQHDDSSNMKARVVDRTFRGAQFLYTLALASEQRVLCLAASHHDHPPGEHIGIRPEMDHVVIFARDD